MKSIYTYYKERLIEISGKNRSLYLKNFNKKNGYDVGRVLSFDSELSDELLDIMLSGKSVPFNIYGKGMKELILSAYNVSGKFPKKTFEDEKDAQKYESDKRNFMKRSFEHEGNHLKTLKREIEEIEKETGRYELYLCYPFVYGSVKNYTFKAPLLMFPVEIDVIDDATINICLKYGENTQLNKALMLAIANSRHLNLQDMEMEFSSINAKFGSLQGLMDYLRSFGVRISYKPEKKLHNFGKYAEPAEGSPLEIKNLCLLSRCSLANSIYSDYSALEKKHLSNDSINELLSAKTVKSKNSKGNELYLINNVDYAQEQVVRNVNEKGNMVIYGPPGTGKSQTIVNVISDAICKNKKVLVVSQKKAALEVVFNRLSTLNDKAMFIIDSEKEKNEFYARCFETHEKVMKSTFDERLYREYDELEKRLEIEIKNLNTISDCLNEKTPFGLSLQEMYYNSYKLGKKSMEYALYQQMKKDKQLMSLTYSELVSALSVLEEKNKAEIYFNYVEEKKKNPFIDALKEDLSVHIVAEAQANLKRLFAVRRALFDANKYKYARQVLTYYDQVKNNKNSRALIRLIAKYEYPSTEKFLQTSCVAFPLYPFAKIVMLKKEKAVEREMQKTLEAVDAYLKDYEFLKNVLTEDGYLLAVDGLLNGNNAILRMLLWAVENYVKLNDTNRTLKNLDENQKYVLNFAYENGSTYQKFMSVLRMVLPVRIYHEIVREEEDKRNILSSTVDFENIRSRIVSIKKQQNEISKKIAMQTFNEEYKKKFGGSNASKDYLYQITKKQNLWSIRKTMEVYGDYLFKLFPCFLLSPENVSTILPLKRNLFDVVLFDEASQVFIENTIPSIYRGNRIVVAGDAKQLRPTTTFMKRYMGAGVDDDMDYTTQAALEVESLLDLAVSRYASSNITYHYRSQNEELIDFSNKVFYSNTLQIAPNISKNIRHKPIERILVNGLWRDRRNEEEAKRVVELVKTLLKTRKNKETIGIITFNVEQENCIEELIDKKCFEDNEFRNLYLKESNRIENGEDVSLFVKNLENVQGDERDIIIFSIGYAKNELGKVNSTFGSLSNEGGENRLNVAITRAKKKIYVVTSIEPEELKVELSKHVGPKLLRSYLTYVRAVSNGNGEEVKTILNSFSESVMNRPRLSNLLPIENQISAKLEKLGYKTDLNLGNSNSKISIAIYDKQKDRYLLGIETDEQVTKSSSSTLERDVFRNEFLKSKGWKVVRVWSRDWWHNPSQVISMIVKEIEKAKKQPETVKSENKKTMAKKPEDKKDSAKKPAEKKLETKKATVKKAESKKTVAKKITAKKAEPNKTEQKSGKTNKVSAKTQTTKKKEKR